MLEANILLCSLKKIFSLPLQVQRNVSPSKYNTKLGVPEMDLNSESLMIIEKRLGRA